MYHRETIWNYRRIIRELRALQNARESAPTGNHRKDDCFFFFQRGLELGESPLDNDGRDELGRMVSGMRHFRWTGCEEIDDGGAVDITTGSLKSTLNGAEGRHCSGGNSMRWVR